MLSRPRKVYHFFNYVNALDKFNTVKLLNCLLATTLALQQILE